MSSKKKAKFEVRERKRERKQGKAEERKKERERQRKKLSGLIAQASVNFECKSQSLAHQSVSEQNVNLFHFIPSSGLCSAIPLSLR